MPKEYEERRDELIRKRGYSKKRAQKRAAREYNARHKKHPVGRKHH